MVVSQSLCGLYIFYKICAQCVTCSSYKLYMCRCLTNIVWENLRSKVTPFALMVLTKLIRIYVCQKWELLWVVNVGVSHQPCYRGSTGSEKVWKSQNYIHLCWFLTYISFLFHFSFYFLVSFLTDCITAAQLLNVISMSMFTNLVSIIWLC